MSHRASFQRTAPGARGVPLWIVRLAIGKPDNFGCPATLLRAQRSRRVAQSCHHVSSHGGQNLLLCLLLEKEPHNSQLVHCQSKNMTVFGVFRKCHVCRGVFVGSGCILGSRSYCISRTQRREEKLTKVMESGLGLANSGEWVYSTYDVLQTKKRPATSLGKLWSLVPLETHVHDCFVMPCRHTSLGCVSKEGKLNMIVTGLATTRQVVAQGSYAPNLGAIKISYSQKTWYRRFGKMWMSLRESVRQGFVEGGWSEKDLQKPLLEVEQRYRPTSPAFAGVVGKVYLSAVIRRLLPTRLHFAWGCLRDSLELAYLEGESLDLFELVQRSAAGQSVATLQKHVSTLHKRGLVTIQKDPHGVKYLTDFAGLNALAVEYHEWCESDGYIDPEAGFVELIRQDPLLVAKLRRFDDYRCLLYKGVKLTETEISRWYTEVHHD